MTVEEFIQALEAKGISLTQRQIDQFATYYQLLVEWNEKINLTAITEKSEVYLKHFYDSLMPLWMASDYFTDQAKLMDVGAGAGFPSFPIKIVRPDLEITIVDSLNKRINFLNLLSEELGLEKVQAVHGRAEEVGQNKDYRGQYDLVTARAVASLNVLSELCLPMVQKGGYFVALKAQRADEEIQQAQKAITTLGAKFEEQISENLPVEESEREIIVIKKTLDTPKKYPRRPGMPTKKPL
ncbi:16S rRNA (guanine(527)-N(7))-methyltransferase RsmG [Aerococcaceae bacterium WGS1372]